MFYCIIICVCVYTYMCICVDMHIYTLYIYIYVYMCFFEEPWRRSAPTTTGGRAPAPATPWPE